MRALGSCMCSPHCTHLFITRLIKPHNAGHRHGHGHVLWSHAQTHHIAQGLCQLQSSQAPTELLALAGQEALVAILE